MLTALKAEPNRIPLDLSHGLYLALKEAKGNGALTNDLVQEAKIIISKTRGRGWNWPRHWAAHSYLCWTQNFVKAYQCATLWAQKQKASGGQINVLDIGCGAGASTAGVAVALADFFDRIIIHGVDNSSEMISHCDKTFRAWADFSSRIKATTEFGRAESYICQNLNNWDLVVASYLFCADPSLNVGAFHHPSMILIDLPDNGFSRISVCGDNYKIGYSDRMLDVSYLSKLGLDIQPDDWYPEVVRI